MNKFFKTFWAALLAFIVGGILLVVLGVMLFLAGFLGELINRNSSDRNTYLIDKEIK